MKGLLKKDLYSTWAYLKMFLFLGIGFLGFYHFNDGANLFFLSYPCIIISTIAGTLFLYDEREKWDVYMLCMPVSRAMAVSSKYVFGLLSMLLLVVANLAFGVTSMLIAQSFDIVSLVFTSTLVAVLSLVPVAIVLPCSYKFGGTKGRLVYLLVLGAACAFVPLGAANVNASAVEINMQSIMLAMLVLLAASVVLFAVSWLISIAVYRNKEL